MKFICRAALVALSFTLSLAARAETWPAQLIKAYIPFGAGSATDIIPRTVFDALSKDLGQPITVENKGGAGGTLGIGEVVRAKPDGYTILANSSAHAIAPFIVPNFPYDVAKDLSGVLMIGQNANVMLVLPSKGWKTVQDFVAAAKAKPGAMNFGSAGVGSATHICGERLRPRRPASKRPTFPTKAARKRWPIYSAVASISYSLRFRSRCRDPRRPSSCR